MNRPVYSKMQIDHWYVNTCQIYICIKNKGKLYSDLVLDLIIINYNFQMGNE